MERSTGERRSRAGSHPAALLVVVAAAVAVVGLGGCVARPAAPTGPSSNGRVRVVAAENFWGSIAAQLGGAHASVTSIISNPNTDPHDYEPLVQDARNISVADLVLFNGAGYDQWAQRVLAASPNTKRIELNVGDLVGVPPGGNPHRWYAPADVHKVVEQIAADYKRADPADAAYFDQRRRAFETTSLARYDSLVAQIRSKYGGTPIGASESVVSPLADALGLKVLTPATFLTAVSEGEGPTAADKATVDGQIRSKQIKVFIYNEQNSTPDIVALVNEAKANGIPVVTITETLVPATATFQDWQSAQLESLQRALAQATGR